MTQTNKTAIICFRAHKNLKSWLVYSGRGFTGGKSELLRLVIIRATMEQPHNNGLGSFLARIVGNSRQPSIGNTSVFAVRLPMDITKAKTYWLLIDNSRYRGRRDRWFRTREISDIMNLNLQSLLVLLKKWSGPGWHRIKRHQVAGYYVYQIANSGYQWFERWRFMMSLREWKAEIQEWQIMNDTKNQNNQGGV